MSMLMQLLNGGDVDDGQLDWMDQALCAQTDPELFFPEKGGSTRDAKKVCQACEVREDCLARALDTGERWGIWGGLSERERRALRRGEEPAVEEPDAAEPAAAEAA
jgi:WhiB family transcriptional regulator, redox-sensing transcriptional regulator